MEFKKSLPGRDQCSAGVENHYLRPRAALLPRGPCREFLGGSGAGPQWLAGQCDG